MEFNDLYEQAMGYAQPVIDVALEWLMSPAAWSQFGLLVAAYVLARLANRMLQPRLTNLLTPAAENESVFAQARRFVLMFLPLLLPLLAYGFTALGEQVTRSIFGSGDVIAFGKRVFIFLAARAMVRDIISDPFLKLLGKYCSGLVNGPTAALPLILSNKRCVPRSVS